MGFHSIQIIPISTTRIIIHSQAIDKIFSIEATTIYGLIVNYNIKRFLKYCHIGREYFYFQVYRCDVDTFN